MVTNSDFESADDIAEAWRHEMKSDDPLLLLTRTFKEASTPHGAGRLTLVGGSGWALEFRHGLHAILEPFAGCADVWGFLQRLMELNETVLAGIFLFIAIMMVSTISIGLGVWRLTSGTLQGFKFAQSDQTADTGTPDTHADATLALYDERQEA